MAPNLICSIPDCGKRHAAQGYCFEHRYRMKRYGDPLFVPPINQGRRHKYLRDVVLKHEGDECLFWPFPAPPNSYPIITYDREQIGVHRLVCILAHGEPPTPEHHAAHSCGKGHLFCVTKGHLSWKTAKQNSDDKIIHGTMKYGEESATSKLTERDVLEIREIGRQKTQAEIAKMFNIDRSTVGYILRRAIWAHLPS